MTQPGFSKGARSLRKGLSHEDFMRSWCFFRTVRLQHGLNSFLSASKKLSITQVPNNSPTIHFESLTTNLLVGCQPCSFPKCANQQIHVQNDPKNPWIPTTHVISGSPPQPWPSRKGSDPLVHRRAPGPQRANRRLGKVLDFMKWTFHQRKLLMTYSWFIHHYVNVLFMVVAYPLCWGHDKMISISKLVDQTKKNIFFAPFSRLPTTWRWGLCRATGLVGPYLPKMGAASWYLLISWYKKKSYNLLSTKPKTWPPKALFPYWIWG